MNYVEISQKTMSHLYQAHATLKDSPLDQHLRALLELRVSQINGCAYCCSIHSNEAKKFGVAAHKIEQLENWKESADFSDAEKEALSWAEALTTLSTPLKVKETKLSAYFNERKIVDITICISLMNALNRLAISLRND